MQAIVLRWLCLLNTTEFYVQVRIQRGGHRSPKTYESNFIHPEFAQFGKQHSRYNAILSSIVLSQQYCEV